MGGGSTGRWGGDVNDPRTEFETWADSVRGALGSTEGGLAATLEGRPAPDLADLLEELGEADLAVGGAPRAAG